MATCMMPAEYGSELLLGSSPSVGHGFHQASSGFFSDYHRCGSPVMAHTSFASSPSSSFTSYSSSFSSLSSSSSSAANFPGALMVPQEAQDSRKLYARTGSFRRSKKLERSRGGDSPPPPLLLTSPSKSILRSQEEEPQVVAPPLSPRKKKVSFADTLGQQLAMIKVITERPECPPLWSPAFIERVTGGLPPSGDSHAWELAFPQPVADYVAYKSRLDRLNVALENAVLKEDQSEAVVAGVVKVRNMSFHKQITVRYTYDNWCTDSDVDATYIPAPVTTSSYDLYDRFSFELPLPCRSETDKVEFCIRFSCDGMEHWDNNDSRNYTVISFRAKQPHEKPSKKGVDAYRMSMDSWSDFAAWNNLETNDSPYW